MDNDSFLKKIIKLNRFHYKNSKEFRKIINLFFKNEIFNNLKDLPFIPARLFKEVNLKSIPDKKVFKILNSSGTTRNVLSKIFLDKENAENQTKVLNEIVSEVIGKKRLPMLIIDEKIKISNKNNFNAKTAAIIGFSIFGYDHTYLIKDKKIDYEILNNFLKKYGKTKFLVFGFTSVVYDYLIRKFNKKKLRFNFSKATLIHGGGWKKMSSIGISNSLFKKELNKKLRMKNIFNYYGLIEQTGSIFFECQICGCFNPSKYSDVLIRDKKFNIVKEKKIGYIQLLSLLPTSYPGHSILTEDLGEIIEKKCRGCENKKKFLVHGRVKQSEIRGCSDT